ncbi:MAG: NAD-dependent deacylase, partial [Desulfobulbaceae bacterium]|nr:NAD-dependent deacylase [Desulfobulbaceae bacterium]
GVSAESGVPTFRGPDGLWQGHRVEDVATAEAVALDRWGVNDFFNQLRRDADRFKPNPAHEALTAWEKAHKGGFLLVTQNIDPLHEKSGSKKLAHMHGELARVRCDDCEESSSFEGDVKRQTPCPGCGAAGTLRPDIVLFGERPKEMDRIMAALENCDLFVAIGTSGFVYPAAGFVDVANRVGAMTIEVNTSATERSPAFQKHWVGPAGQKVPVLVESLLKGQEGS